MQIFSGQGADRTAPVRSRGGWWTAAALFFWAAAPPAADASSGAGGSAGATPSTIVEVEFFFEPGCRECEWVEGAILPELQSRYEGFYALVRYDLGLPGNYFRLVERQDALGDRNNAHVFLVIDRRLILSGEHEIESRLWDAMDRAVLRTATDTSPEQAASPPATCRNQEGDAVAPGDATAALQRRLNQFTVAGVALAGLTDGINPCAFSTLVFLISVLGVSHVRGRRLLIVGAAFCLASFLTYTAIGFGLLGVLHRMRLFPVARLVLDVALLGALLVLAWLSFRDAIRFARSGKPGDVTLQLPDGVKRHIHGLVRRGLGGSRGVWAAFLVGAGVTALESVCTGQLYGPTLVWLARGGHSPARSVAYLLLYNGMFVLPLVAVFVLTWQGLRLADLMAWSVRNVVLSKVLLGVVFLALAVAVFAVLHW